MRRWRRYQTAEHLEFKGEVNLGFAGRLELTQGLENTNCMQPTARLQSPPPCSCPHSHTRVDLLPGVANDARHPRAMYLAAMLVGVKLCEPSPPPPPTPLDAPAVTGVKSGMHNWARLCNVLGDAVRLWPGVEAITLDPGWWEAKAEM
jgi:hypothetical protein